jgi:hypothetical protein
MIVMQRATTLFLHQISTEIHLYLPEHFPKAGSSLSSLPDIWCECISLSYVCLISRVWMFILS